MDNYSTFGYNRVTAIMSLTICQWRKKQERERDLERERKVKFERSPPRHVTLGTDQWAQTHACTHADSLFMNKVIWMHRHGLDWGLNPSNWGEESKIETVCAQGDERTGKTLDKGISNAEKHKMETSATWNFSVWLFVFFLSEEECSLALLRPRSSANIFRSYYYGNYS